MSLKARIFLLGIALLLPALVGVWGFVGAGSSLVAAGIGGVILVWGAASMVSADFRRRLDDLASEVRNVARGDGPPARSARRPPPELADLERSLDDLGDEMRARIDELEGERDEIRGLVDSIAEGVMALTPDARVLRMNRAAADLLDLSPLTLFAPVGALVRHPELRDYLEESVLSPLHPRELLVGERHLLVSSHFLEGGGSVVTFLEVTGIRRMEQIRRDFVANASHELKTPLTSIRGFTETLLDDDPPEPLRRQFLESVRNNTVRLQNLVDNLLDLSRLESGAWSAEEEDVDVGEAALEAWEQVTEERSRSNVRFEVEGKGEALADRQALNQIFRNLLDNALRYTPDGGRIHVRVSDGAPHVRVEVSDTGTGIPSSALPRIFERFYRADPGRDRKEGGTGLGLAIVRHLVQSMGGEVGAESQLGRGTTVRFTLPRGEGSGPEPSVR